MIANFKNFYRNIENMIQSLKKERSGLKTIPQLKI